VSVRAIIPLAAQPSKLEGIKEGRGGKKGWGREGTKSYYMPDSMLGTSYMCLMPGLILTIL